MKKPLVYTLLIFMIFITGVTVFCIRRTGNDNKEERYREQLVNLNEIVQLSKQGDPGDKQKVELAIAKFKKQLSVDNEAGAELTVRETLWLQYGFCIIFLLIVFAYVYRVILHPFNKLENYAEEIAMGNFDIELQYERTNYFGKFTWAFDHMRREITKARACEREAIDNNKTVIATLSHDIKTPIASIRAYAEGLDANLNSGPEMRRKYCSVIMKKCDEVTKLTDDLFLHSLSDLDKLKLNPQKTRVRELLLRIIGELQLSDPNIRIQGEIPDFCAMVDDKRFEQVIENLINNAKKYAPQSEIDISCKMEEESISIVIRDYGQGIPDEDMPFVFDKFYRGRNAGENQGSGLGLYIVRYIMEQMGGSVSLNNSKEGLCVILKIPPIS